MSTIQETFEVSLERVVRDHLIGNRSGERKNWHWTLRPGPGNRDISDIINKLKLILSWVLGHRVIHMNPEEVLKHTIEEYKKCNYYGYMGMKYGEYCC